MKILTHAEDCPDPRSGDPLQCVCAGDFKNFDTLADGFNFDCARCGKMKPLPEVLAYPSCQPLVALFNAVG